MNQGKDLTTDSLPAIKVSGLTKTFGNQFALRNVSFELRRGQFWTIFGPNGAGKTTLIRILSTLSKATSGTVEIDGMAPAQAPEKIRRRVGVIAHQSFLYENLTAEENLRFYGKLYNVPDLNLKIDKIISEVGLRLRRKDRVRTFSRGMQQRLSIARAMLHEPSLLLLDEPYTGLDQHASEMLSGWLKELKSSDRTTLMVTHDLERGVDLADQVAILNKGKMVFNRACSEIDANGFRQTYYDFVEDGRSAR
ncbi:MAG: ABC transporter ATP-binding protein [bacterium]